MFRNRFVSFSHRQNYLRRPHFNHYKSDTLSYNTLNKRSNEISGKYNNCIFTSITK